jgi:hypothetical protein
MIFLYLKKGISERGIRILFVAITRNNIFFTFNGIYQNSVGAVKIIIIPYNGMKSG